jgi:hypothetical protein
MGRLKTRIPRGDNWVQGILHIESNQKFQDKPDSTPDNGSNFTISDEDGGEGC